MSEYHFSRRYFFYGSLLAGAVPSVGLGNAASAPAVGYKSLNEKMNIACIGLGLRGPQILLGAAASENIVALCDVDDQKMERTGPAYPKAAKYKDFRKMLEKEGKNIDGVFVATPDHLHAPIALFCMQNGKHVYVEKPLTSTIWETRLLADAAAKYKVATQMGNQGFNHEGTKTACEIVWSGGIGDVREVHAWTGSGASAQMEIPDSGLPGQPVPDTLDWDLWLGPAAQRPYNPAYSRWRSFLDFSMGGSLGDWLVHILGPAHLALQLDTVSPTSVECVSVEGKSRWLWPLRVHSVFEFPARGTMPPVTIHVYQNMRGDFRNPPGMAENEPLLPRMNNLAERGRSFVDAGDGVLAVGDQVGIDGKLVPAQSLAGGQRGGRGPQAPAGAAGGRAPQPPVDPALRPPGNGTVFVGSKGWLATSGRGEGVWLLPASRWADYKLPPQVLPRGLNHQQDWIRACKGGAPGVSQFSVTSKYVSWLGLAAIAWRVRGKLLWDAKNARFSNSEEANKYLTPFVRKGWEMKL